MTKRYSVGIVFYNAVVTKCYYRVIVFCRAGPFGAPTVIVRAALANTRHSRESGNPEAGVRYIGPVFLAETPQADSRFRGNDEE